MANPTHARRIFKTRPFRRWMKKTELTDALLLAAIAEMEKGLIDADHGGGLYKKRVALPGRGKSGSVRTLIASNLGSRWFFLDGFEKKDKADITNAERDQFKATARALLALDTQTLATLTQNETLTEIKP